LRRSLLCCLAACGAPADQTIDLTHDVCSSITVSAPTGTAEQLAGIDAAIALWADRGAASISQAEPPAILIEFADAAPNFHGLYDDEVGIVYVNRRISDPQILSIVIAHELGHAFGLPHTEQHTSVMRPGNLDTPPTEGDQLELERLWGRCE
jgi:hypothetical protein